MDTDQSSGTPPAKTSSGEDDIPPSSLPAPAASNSAPSLIGRLLGWSGNGTQAVSTETIAPDTLGPAFADSAPAELAMVTNILRLRDLRVDEVMTPRADIEAVAEDATLDEVIDTFERGSFSRLPVYCETLDDPRGFVHLKDLALHYGFGRNGGAASFRLSDHIRTALFVPPSMRIAALLQKMQGDRVHMALVIDEFGGVDGLVTIEDLVEQIVGDIEDEHDEQEGAAWSQLSSGVYAIDARADIRAFEEAENVSLVLEGWDEDVGTLGGLVFMLANRVPARGEVIIHPTGHEFEVVDADPRRIKRLRLSLANGTGNSAVRQAAE